MALTYRQLSMRLMGMTQQELDQTATVYVAGMDEYLPIREVSKAEGTGVLDAGHPVIEVEA